MKRGLALHKLTKLKAVKSKVRVLRYCILFRTWGEE
jgi:hypothetical protein